MQKRIAIIGSGVSGLTAALLLNDRYDIHVLESQPRIGGHAHTVEVDTKQGRVAVDTGFIVFNPRRYRQFVAMLDYLRVASATSDMSFSVSLNDGRFEYSGTKLGLLMRPDYWFSSDYWRLLYDLLRFYRTARHIATQVLKTHDSVADLIQRMGLSAAFVNGHLLPMVAAIWSTPPARMLAFPAQALIRFMDNHQLLDFSDRPQWRFIQGGSHHYVDAIARRLSRPIETGVRIQSISRHKTGVRLRLAAAGRGVEDRHYDGAVLAAHADESLALLADASPLERSILSQFRFQANTAVLHCDARAMPRRRRLWGAWNYMEGRGSGATKSQLSVTYWMNRLQNIRHDCPLFVSLNPYQPIAADKIYGVFDYTHPVFDAKTHHAQRQLARIQGQHRLFFCGAWTGWGFHEDGVMSAIAVAKRLGVGVPWAQVGLRGGLVRLRQDRRIWRPSKARLA